jgi:serine/threonine-protein kinase Chk2
MFGLIKRFLQVSPGDQDFESFKKVRRSERLSQKSDRMSPDKTPVDKGQQLPSPLTNLTTDDTSQRYKEDTATPPEGRSQLLHHRLEDEAFTQGQAFSSPPQDTQAFPSQHVDPNAALSEEVEDEVKEGVWGYLLPLDTRYGGRCLVLRKRAAYSLPDTGSKGMTKKTGQKGLLKAEDSKAIPSGGYLIGRHPECGKSNNPANTPFKLKFEAHLRQMSLSMTQLYPTGIACYLRSTKAMTRWPF